MNNARNALVQNNSLMKKISIVIDNGLIIKDNAGGIEKEIMEKIFEPYFTTSPNSKSRGIGLYISKLLIEESMQGKLWVTNSKHGAVFHINV